MARINGISMPGVTIQKDLRGNESYVRINLNRCSDEILDFFTSIGVRKEAPQYDPKYVKKIKERELQPSVKIDINDYL